MSAEDLERYETEIELQLYREYRDVLPMFQLRRRDRAPLLSRQRRQARRQAREQPHVLRPADARRVGVGHVPPDAVRRRRARRHLQRRQRRGASRRRSCDRLVHLVGSATGKTRRRAGTRSAGYEVLDRNWRVREGELDLIARRGSTIVFCEVKTRRSDAFGSPAEAVTARKQRADSRACDRSGSPRRRMQARPAAVRCRRGAPDGRGDWIVHVIEAAFLSRFVFAVPAARVPVAAFVGRVARDTTLWPSPGRISWSQPGQR